MLMVFHRSGLDLRSRFDGEVCHLEARFPDAASNTNT
jgi:hypothetical protein